MKTHLSLNFTPASGLLHWSDVMLGRTLEDYLATKQNVFNSPNGDFTDEGEFYRLKIVVPGLNRNDISIEIDDRMMKVYGCSNLYSATDRVEFRRSFVLPWNADADNIKAKCRDGILIIDVDKIGRKARGRAIRVDGATEKNLSIMKRAQRFAESSWSRVRSAFNRLNP